MDLFTELQQRTYLLTYLLIVWQRRALKIQQQKQTEALQAEQRRERELEKERALAARDVSKKNSTKSRPR